MPVNCGFISEGVTVVAVREHHLETMGFPCAGGRFGPRWAVGEGRRVGIRSRRVRCRADGTVRSTGSGPPRGGMW